MRVQGVKHAMVFALYISCIGVCFAWSKAGSDIFAKKKAYVQSALVGCELNNQTHPVGTRMQMNHVELKAYKEKTGFRASDGYAIMMICLYLVDPLSPDHPAIDKREYVWVAS